jgi:hypothetical protein
MKILAAAAVIALPQACEPALDSEPPPVEATAADAALPDATAPDAALPDAQPPSPACGDVVLPCGDDCVLGCDSPSRWQFPGDLGPWGRRPGFRDSGGVTDACGRPTFSENFTDCDDFGACGGRVERHFRYDPAGNLSLDVWASESPVGFETGFGWTRHTYDGEGFRTATEFASVPSAGADREGLVRFTNDPDGRVVQADVYAVAAWGEPGDWPVPGELIPADTPHERWTYTWQGERCEVEVAFDRGIDGVIETRSVVPMPVAME